MLEVSLLGVGTVLRLERDAWSMIKWLRQATSEYTSPTPPPPPLSPSFSGAIHAPSPVPHTAVPICGRHPRNESDSLGDVFLLHPPPKFSV